MNRTTSIPIKLLPGIRFIRSKLIKELTLFAAAIAVSLCTASAQFTYTGGTLSASQTYDGLGADSGLNPYYISSFQDDYVSSGATLTVLSGTLSIDANDFKIGNNGSAGTLILGENATLNINNGGQWGGGVGWWNNNVGTVIISNNATLNWMIAGSSEQRFAVGGGQSTAAGTITLEGGAVNVTYGAAFLGDGEAQFSVGGANGTGTLNLNAGTLTDSLPLPFCLGCYYTAVTSLPTLGQSASVDLMNILNGTFVVDGIFLTDPIYPDRASVNVGTNSYVNFIPGGSGSLSLINWTLSDYQALVTNSQIRVADCPTTMSTLSYSSVGGMGILKLGSSLVVAASPISPNVVFAGVPITLHATLYGFTNATVQWQAGPDGVTWTNISAATSTNHVVDTSIYVHGATIYYQLVATNSGGATATSAALLVTILPPGPPILSLTSPESVTVYEGEAAQFSVAAIGVGPFAYQRHFNNGDLTNSAYVSGVTTPTVTLHNLTLGEGGSYQVVVTNAYGSTATNATLAVLPAPSGQLVGHWLAGAATLADVSGYQPAGTHDGFFVNANGFVDNAWFTNDVPPTATGGQSLYFATNADTLLVVSNSSIAFDFGYTNTYDDQITNGFTLMFWAKGSPGAWSWNPWVSKYGEGGQGWQFRTGGAAGAGGGATPCWTVRGGAGSFALGGGPSWAENGDQEDLHATISGTAAEGNLDYFGCDNNWHCYAGTFDLTLGIRNLYIDGKLYAKEINQGAYILASSSYFTIGGRDNGGYTFANYFTGNIYDVRIYDYPLVQSAVRNVGGFKPSLSIQNTGDNAVLNWDYGTLLGATYITGPWTPVSTDSPYTNSMPASQHFFRVSNP